jgi:hypothetical protein
MPIVQIMKTIMLWTYEGHAKPLCFPETLAHFTRLTPIPHMGRMAYNQQFP